MKSLTVAYVTSRKHPEAEWFLQSLASQVREGDAINVVVVDYHSGMRAGLMIQNGAWGHVGASYPLPLLTVPCKPNVWQGPHRFTKSEWWAKSAYINTAICLCKTDWIAFVDDRSVLMPTWLQSVREAMDGNYAVAGSYEKRRDMTVENGSIQHGGTVIGTDPRKVSSHAPIRMTGGWWFGCTNALPLEWALEINGADECCDSLGMEDVVFGSMLAANGFPMKYDERMAIVEDRTPEFYEAAVGRTDLGVSPNDKSHGILSRTAGKKRATHHWNLREVRDLVQRGEPFPIPTEPTHDWWDGRPLSEFP